MQDILKEQLNCLLRASSPSGFEEQVVNLFREYIAPFVDSVSLDVNGNCIAHKKGNGRSVMLVAHSDEVGLMITHIDDSGFLYFKEIGGIDTNLLPGRRVRIKSNSDGEIVGVIGKKPLHLQERSASSKELNPEDLWIDIAAKDKVEADQMVQLGSVATFLSDPCEMNNGLICSKSLDDRVGLAVLLGVASRLHESDADVYYVASIQEELGAIGIQMVASSIMPDIGIAVDVTHATDYPTISVIKDGEIYLGKGAVIAVGPNMNKKVSQGLISKAQQSRLAYQVEAIARPTGTDARMIQIAGTGIMTGLVSIPCRYMHTPNEMVAIVDVDSTIDLLVDYIS